MQVRGEHLGDGEDDRLHQAVELVAAALAPDPVPAAAGGNEAARRERQLDVQSVDVGRVGGTVGDQGEENALDAETKLLDAVEGGRGVGRALGGDPLQSLGAGGVEHADLLAPSQEVGVGGKRLAAWHERLARCLPVAAGLTKVAHRTPSWRTRSEGWSVILVLSTWLEWIGRSRRGMEEIPSVPPFAKRGGKAPARPG